MTTVELLMEQVRTLSITERKQLIHAIVDSMVPEASDEPPRKLRNIMEFEGIAAHLRDDNEDPQDMLNRMRDEWDTPR